MCVNGGITLHFISFYFFVFVFVYNICFFNNGSVFKTSHAQRHFLKAQFDHITITMENILIY